MPIDPRIPLLQDFGAPAQIGAAFGGMFDPTQATKLGITLQQLSQDNAYRQAQMQHYQAQAERENAAATLARQKHDDDYVLNEAKPFALGFAQAPDRANAQLQLGLMKQHPDPRVRARAAQWESMLSQVPDDKLQTVAEGLRNQYPEWSTQAAQLAYAPKAEPKPPQMRTRNVGGTEIQEQWNAASGKWEKIGEAPRWQPVQAEKPQKPIYDATRGVFVDPATRQATPVTMGGQPLPSKAEEKPLTESQGNATAFGMRAQASHDILQSLEDQGTYGYLSSGAQAVRDIPYVGAVPGMIANYAVGAVSPQSQQYTQAKKNFVTAVLRKESGAAISASEFENEDKKYFPQPGDSAAAIKQKQEARELAIDALKVQAGPGAKQIGPPKIGTIKDGYRFKGGDPSKPESWEKAK